MRKIVAAVMVVAVVVTSVVVVVVVTRVHKPPGQSYMAVEPKD